MSILIIITSRVNTMGLYQENTQKKEGGGLTKCRGGVFRTLACGRCAPCTVPLCLAYCRCALCIDIVILLLCRSPLGARRRRGGVSSTLACAIVPRMPLLGQYLYVGEAMTLLVSILWGRINRIITKKGGGRTYDMSRGGYYR